MFWNLNIVPIFINFAICIYTKDKNKTKRMGNYNEMKMDDTLNVDETE